MGAKFHITSYRVWVSQLPKHGKMAPQKFNFLQKWPNLQSRFGHCKHGGSNCSDRSFCIHEEFFCAILLVYELLMILYFTLPNSDLRFGCLAGKQRSLALRNMLLTLTFP